MVNRNDVDQALAVIAALTASALPFWADPAPITCAVNARFGYTLKDPAGDSITTQLKSIAR
jgi:hypothetical protein